MIAYPPYRPPHHDHAHEHSTTTRPALRLAAHYGQLRVRPLERSCGQGPRRPEGARHADRHVDEFGPRNGAPSSPLPVRSGVQQRARDIDGGISELGFIARQARTLWAGEHAQGPKWSWCTLALLPLPCSGCPPSGQSVPYRARNFTTRAACCASSACLADDVEVRVCYAQPSCATSCCPTALRHRAMSEGSWPVVTPTR